MSLADLTLDQLDAWRAQLRAEIAAMGGPSRRRKPRTARERVEARGRKTKRDEAKIRRVLNGPAFAAKVEAAKDAGELVWLSDREVWAMGAYTHHDPIELFAVARYGCTYSRTAPKK